MNPAVISETVHLRVRGTCPCGRPLERDDRVPEPAGEVSLARLADLALSTADLTRCLCGAFTGRAGDTYAGYRLPGNGPWLVARATLAPTDREVELSVRAQLPAGIERTEALYPLPVAELEAAQRLGQAVSVRAAWHEALFSLHLGARTLSFPYGAGLRCIATTDQNASGTLDLAVLEEQTAHWLGENARTAIDSGDILCLVDADPDVVDRELEAEARRRGLTVHPAGARRVTVTLPDGHFAHQLDTRELLATAVGSGCALALVTTWEVDAAHTHLAQLESAAAALAHELAPTAIRAPNEGATLAFDYPHRTLPVDVQAYASANAGAQAQMLDNWRNQTR